MTAGNDDAVNEVRPKDSRFRYPFAASPDVIRANQKDAYFQGVLLDQLSNALRGIYGARFTHTWSNETRTLADLLYLGLTTLIGNRTLGEEYCDIVQVEDDSLQLPSIKIRSGYIVTSILLPYALNRILPGLRRRMRETLEQSVAKQNSRNPKSRLAKFQSYVLNNLDTMTSPSPIYALSLATFYFSGAYYHLSKRLWGLRYIFTRNLPPSDQRAGYEVLGVLLVLQLAVQSYVHLHETLAIGAKELDRPAEHHNPRVENAGALPAGSAVLEGGVEVVSLDPNTYTSNNTLLFDTGPDVRYLDAMHKKIALLTNTPVLAEPRYDLSNKNSMQWLEARQTRKCALCLEPMIDASTTTCGHLFCWTCINDWAREKPECPLCRQQCLVQHILPLRG